MRAAKRREGKSGNQEYHLDESTWSAE
jgi:hypothetical protein